MSEVLAAMTALRNVGLVPREGGPSAAVMAAGWLKVLAALPEGHLAAAVDQYLSEAHAFWPMPGELFVIANRLAQTAKGGPLMSSAEAWGYVDALPHAMTSPPQMGDAAEGLTVDAVDRVEVVERAVIDHRGRRETLRMEYPIRAWCLHPNAEQRAALEAGVCAIHGTEGWRRLRGRGLEDQTVPSLFRRGYEAAVSRGAAVDELTALADRHEARMLAAHGAPRLTVVGGTMADVLAGRTWRRDGGGE